MSGMSEREITDMPKTYKSPRTRAWRNLMVAAINAGLEQGHFGLTPDDNRWPGFIPHDGRHPPTGAL
jgi:hypothetical protein